MTYLHPDYPDISLTLTGNSYHPIGGDLHWEYIYLDADGTRIRAIRPAKELTPTRSKNQTGRKSLDFVEDDIRVMCVEWDTSLHFGDRPGGYCLELTPGYKCDDCITIHAWSIRDLLNYMDGIVEQHWS